MTTTPRRPSRAGAAGSRSTGRCCSWSVSIARSSGAIRHLARYEPRKRPEGHACALVGYTEAGFIIRNSWGRDWGRDGYATAAPEWLRRGWSESYGLVV